MSDELQAAIDKAVADATSNLVEHNKKLLKDLKETQEKFSAFSSVDLEGLKNDSSELAKLKKAKMEEDGEYKKIADEMKLSHEKTVKELADEKERLKNELQDTKKTNALTLALSKQKGFINDLTDVAVNTLKDKVAFGEDGKAVVGDKPVAEYVASWAETDVGKHFIKSGNTGGGSNGAGGGKTDSAAKFFDPDSKHYNLTEQGKIAKADATRYKALKDQFA